VDASRLEIDRRQRSALLLGRDDRRLGVEEAPVLAQVGKLSAAHMLILKVKIMKCSLHALASRRLRTEVSSNRHAVRRLP
jgi:hypothetical protein